MSGHGDPFGDFLNSLPNDEQDERSAALEAGLARRKDADSLVLTVIPAILHAMNGDFRDLTPLQRQIAYAVAERFHPLGDGVVDWIDHNAKVEQTARIIVAAFLSEHDMKADRDNPGELPLP